MNDEPKMPPADPAPGWTTTDQPAAPAPAVPAKRPKKVKPPSRGDRWAQAVGAAKDALAAIQAAHGDLETAMADLCEVQSEYSEWKDNLDGKFEGSALVEKLDAVCDLSFDSIASDLETAIGEAESTLDDAEGAELPLGFGRD